MATYEQPRHPMELGAGGETGAHYRDLPLGHRPVSPAPPAPGPIQSRESVGGASTEITVPADSDPPEGVDED